MALVWVSSPSRFHHKNPNSITFSSPVHPFSLCFLTVRTAKIHGTSKVSEQQEPSLLRRPLVSSTLPAEEAEEKGKRAKRAKAADEWLDWEDQILGDTVPLVGFVRTILHSGKYNSGDRLIPEHEKIVLEKLLEYHPAFERKIGRGIDYITIGFHPEFENSRCLFIVRKDGELVDFSYWKCIKGLIRKNYPLYADSFILRHFRKRKDLD